MRVIETKIYTIEEHPNKQKCFEWIRNNWRDLNYHIVDEVIESIKALSKVIGGTYDYSIGEFPDSGDYITFKDYDQETLYNLSSENCPLTGVCWDIDLIEGLRKDSPEEVLKSLHSSSEYVYSDEGLRGLCEINGYEFTEEGEFYF